MEQIQIHRLKDPRTEALIEQGTIMKKMKHTKQMLKVYIHSCNLEFEEKTRQKINVLEDELLRLEAV